MQNGDSRISYLNNLVYVEKYGQVINISVNKIVLSDFSISGYKLKIDKLDGYLMIISGNIKNIRIGRIENDNV